jgi:ATP-dependent protease Clp ATPase subunit
MFRRRLVCSFCGRHEDQVAKLVAGPRVYICDACVAVADRLMKESGPAASRVRQSLFSSLSARIVAAYRRPWFRLRLVPRA